ncbi:hypothetical protein GEMRC1_004220 [Eukaryota sp. GEM-RC1]
MNFDNTLKVICVGNGTVGKTSLCIRFCNGSFTSTYKKTLSVDFLEKSLYIDSLDSEVVFNVFDTAGQEEYDSLTSTYYRGAQGIIIVFATDNRGSFESIDEWVKKVQAHCDDVPTVLVQNKIDLVDKSVVSEDEAQRKAEELGIPLFRTSALDNANVSDVFEYLSTKYLSETHEEESMDEDQPVNLDENEEETQERTRKFSLKMFKCSIH